MRPQTAEDTTLCLDQQQCNMEPPAGPSVGSFDYDLLVIGGGSGGLAVAKVS